MNFSQARHRMVETQIARRGIHDQAVIQALKQIPRHEFVDESLDLQAYEDGPLAIGCGQTISQPYMVALMTEALELNKQKKVLEIGTGSGYQSAVCALLAQKVVSIERNWQLSVKAHQVLQNQHIHNVHLLVADGTVCHKYLKETFHSIIITAASPTAMPQWLDLLEEGGSMVVPIGERSGQTLTVLRKQNGTLKEEQICRCVFVPLIGEYGFAN